MTNTEIFPVNSRRYRLMMERNARKLIRRLRVEDKIATTYTPPFWNTVAHLLPPF